MVLSALYRGIQGDQAPQHDENVEKVPQIAREAAADVGGPVDEKLGREKECEGDVRSVVYRPEHIIGLRLQLQMRGLRCHVAEDGEHDKKLEVARRICVAQMLLQVAQKQPPAVRCRGLVHCLIQQFHPVLAHSGAGTANGKNSSKIEATRDCFDLKRQGV